MSRRQAGNCRYDGSRRQATDVERRIPAVETAPTLAKPTLAGWRPVAEAAS
ncbi:MAG: hypothetical protein ACE5F6_06100 [Anaerolineae bacterium]